MTQIVVYNQEGLHKVGEVLQDFRPVALPTETVYGLAANALSEEAVAHIFAYKERPKFDPLIVHIAEEDFQLPVLAKNGIINLDAMSENSYRTTELLMQRFCPGPLTILFPKGPKIPGLVTSGLSEVALRSPNHEVFQAVLRHVSFPLAAPSANRFGRTSPTCVEHVVQQQMTDLEYVLEGGTCDVGIESTVVRIRDDGHIEILRAGAVTQEQLSTVAYVEKHYLDGDHLPHAPGMLKHHYAPTKPCFRFERSQMLQIKCDDRTLFLVPTLKEQEWLSSQALHKDKVLHSWVISPSGSGREAAQKIFSLLHDFSNSPYQQLFVMMPEIREGLWMAIADKLEKASQPFVVNQ